MTFGGSPCPALWGIILECIANKGISLLHNPFWDHNSLFNPISTTLDDPLHLPDNIPFHAAKELSVKLPTNPLGYIDIYIDDNIGVTPDLNDNALRMNQAIPLAIHTLAHPIGASDVIPRRDIISLKKFKAEGQLHEVKKVLGWMLNTWSLQISLPSEKYIEWSNDVSKQITAKKTHHKLLESLIGWINHVACIFHPLRCYLGRLYQALYRSSSYNGWTKLTSTELADPDTILGFLTAAYKGLSLNNLVFRKLTLIYQLDALEFGLGFTTWHLG